MLSSLSRPVMLSLTLRSGSLMVQVPCRSQVPWMVMQLVMNSGPSMARMTSKAEMSWRAGQCVAAVGAGVRDQQAGFGEGLEDLGQQLRRDVVGLGDVLGGGRCAGERVEAGVRLLGEVLERHQAVVRFFGEPEHESWGHLPPIFQCTAREAGSKTKVVGD
jgi:hypothetical protein